MALKKLKVSKMCVDNIVLFALDKLSVKVDVI